MTWPFVVPNQDGAGDIDAVGAGVDPARVGERVWLYFAQWNRQFGTAAEWVCLPEHQAVRLPDAATYELGASLGIPALTAAYALAADGDLAGSTVLVAGGAGAVGHYAIELARRSGARVVTTVSSPAKARLAEVAGAHAVVDYRAAEDPAAAIRKAAGEPIERIVEVAPGNLPLDAELIAPRGAIVCYASAADDPSVPVRALMNLNAVLRFMLIYTVPQADLDQAVADVSSALADGALTELPNHVFALDEIAAAHRAVEQGAVGKVIVDLAR
jgi:NADPH2:quinone reductase